MEDKPLSVSPTFIRAWEEATGEESLPAAKEETLKKWLYAQLSHLLQENFGQLVQVMYRLDVPENQFHEAMNGQDADDITQRLVAIVWERELQRMRYRKGEATI